MTTTESNANRLLSYSCPARTFTFSSVPGVGVRYDHVSGNKSIRADSRLHSVISRGVVLLREVSCFATIK